MRFLSVLTNVKNAYNLIEEDFLMSPWFMIFVVLGSIFLIFVNASFIQMPWEAWFASNISRETAIFITIIIAMILLSFPLTYKHTFRKKGGYFLATLLIILGAFWKVLHRKAPFINGTILLCSVIGFLLIGWVLKKDRTRN